MQLDLLTRRAEKISSGPDVLPETPGNELRVIPSLNFTCNGTITSLLLGADVRSGRSSYPEVQIWRLNSMGTHYDRIDRSSIVLDPGDFSPDGVFRYTLPAPLPFQSGDVLGFYQPRRIDSVVRLYNIQESSSPTIYSQSSNAATISIDNLDSRTDERLLITVEASELMSIWSLQSKCFTQLLLNAWVPNFLLLHC